MSKETLSLGTIRRPNTVGYPGLMLIPPNADLLPALDPNHPNYGAVPGRYANRIGGAKFTVDGVTYNTPQNDGPNTLHSGPNGWGYRTFNVTSVSSNSITFSIHDPDMSTGMPGAVDALITYTLTSQTWKIKITAVSPDKRTRRLPVWLLSNQFWKFCFFFC